MRYTWQSWNSTYYVLELSYSIMTMVHLQFPVITEDSDVRLPYLDGILSDCHQLFFEMTVLTCLTRSKVKFDLLCTGT